MWILLSLILVQPAQAKEPSEDSVRSVVGGEAALEGAWPDAAAIFRGEMLLCTGVLIAPDLVVTAGHCALGVSRVQLGSVDSTAEGVQRDVIQHWVYPDYLTTLDVMLLQLDSPVDIPPRPIALTCIRDVYLNDGADVAIVGFGATDVNATEFGSLLMQAWTTVVDRDCWDEEKDCNPAVSPGGELIAGGDGIDSCVRDSGGPLYLDTPHGVYLTGITSRGVLPSTTPCGEGGIYVRADAFHNWAEEASGQTLPRPDCDSLDLNQRPQPIATETSLTTGESTTLVIDPLDPDPEDQHTFTLLESPVLGQGTVQANGELLYTAPAHLTGIDTLVVRVQDNGTPPLSADVVVTLTVIPPLPTPETSGCGCTHGSSPWAYGGLAVFLLSVCRRRR